jgi:hypothetical protein
MKKLFMVGIVSTFIFIAFFACNNLNDQKKFTIEYNFDEETFLSEWNSWNNQNMQNYSFTLLDGMRGKVDYLLENGIVSEIDLSHTRSISGPPPPDFIEEWKIIVKDGIMDSFEYTYLSPIIAEHNSFIGYGPSNPGSIKPPRYMSISDMYQKLSQSTLFNIGYDLDFHYIKFLHYISWMCGPECEGYCNGNTTSIVSDFIILE